MSYSLQPYVSFRGQAREAMMFYHELFAKLADGAQDTRELQQEQWGAEYGEVLDKYGVRWMFNVVNEV